ncbi:MAG: LysR family transcriptional regulator [Marinicaulis sp.]|nr:LysR family transcriptional regulator [Marinicaulis sp.]
MSAVKLKHIVAVDQAGSVSAAARILGLTQSTVSRSVADIETEIGFALFDRRARDVVATDRGRGFINRAARIISDLDQFSEDARVAREAGDALIRVGVSPASMQGLLNKAIVALMRAQPDLRVHLEAIAVAGGMRALRRGDIDMLVGPENAIAGEDGFVFEKLGDLKTHLFARKGHPLADHTALEPSDITDYPVVAPDQMSWHMDRLRELYNGFGGDAARRMHIFEYFPLVSDVVASSDAIGVISDEYAQSDSFVRRFDLLDIAFFDPLPVGIAIRKRWLPTPSMRALKDALVMLPPGV